MRLVRLARVFASSAALATVTAAAAQASNPDFRDLSLSCSAGALRTCVSLQVTTQTIGTNTLVTIMVRNEQGSTGIDNTLGSIISRIGLVAPVITGASGLSVTNSGATVVGTNPGSYWLLKTPGGLGSPIELVAGVVGPPRNGGILGCTLNTSVGVPPNAFQTCGGSGWVKFQFTTTNIWHAQNAEVAWITQDYVANGQGIECDSDVAGNGRQLCSVTPEPVSMLLMASGLTGVGGFGFLRRRKGQDTPKV